MSAPLPDELPPNFEFGGYVIRACIGRGGMARVYRAEQAALNRPVALKVLDRWVLEKPQGSQRFLREARAAAAIKHPNVVDIVDVGVWQDRPYIVMELLSGSDLESHLAQRRQLSETEVASLALPIIAGMMAVHEAGVIHRDLKPSNIFLANGPDGEVVPKVLDFGVSKFNDASEEEAIHGRTKTREIIGTPTYMAPEALNGAREVGPRADQYALGAVLYECAVGRPPFEGETLLELLKAIAVGDIPPPRSIRPQLSVALEDTILRAMNGNPHARFDSLRDFGRAIWPLGDERTKTIWARSFGSSAHAVTLGGDGASGLVLLASDRHRESSFRGSGRRWGSLRNLAWAAAFLAAGVFVAPYVLDTPDARTGGAASGPPRGVLPPEPPAEVATVERHSLLADAPSSHDGSEPSAAQARELANDVAARSSHAHAPARSSASRNGPAPSVPAPGLAAQSVARNAKPTPARRKAPPARPQPTETLRTAATAEEDADLEGMFAVPGPLEGRPTNSDNMRELDGLFPNDQGLTLGANGAPLPD